MIIAVDFDGTIVEHRYPEIGKKFLCNRYFKDVTKGRTQIDFVVGKRG